MNKSKNKEQEHDQEHYYDHWIGWRSLLLRWVNCLKVTENAIKEIDELKNCKILQCLIEKKTLNNLDQTCDSCNYIKEFLKKQYPSFEISNDLKDSEIVELTSLLIHYFCLKIKDDFIMKVMCKNLTTEDQTDIMRFVNFLIHVSDISNQFIKDAIDDTISNSLTLRAAKENEFFSPHGLSYSPATFTSVSASSPIVTPHSLEKSRSRGRRKRINKLEADLETEKFEKNCLREEIDDLQKEIQNLVKSQTEYRNTISRLRTEIDIANNRNCDEIEEKNDLSEFQNCLRKEISSLENELLKAMGENGQLHEERENFKKQILSMEQSLLSWKTKAVSLQQNEEYIKNQLNTKTVECADLKISLFEANKFLEEYRQQNLMNVSVECDDDSVSRKYLMSPAVNSPGEPLNVIVEVQLREQLVKNQILTDTVESLKSEKKNFEDKCKGYEEQLRQNDLKIDELKNAIEQFEKEMSEFEKCKKQFDTNEQKLKTEIETKQKILDQNKDLQAEIDKVKTELNNLHKTTLDQTSIIEDLSQKNEDFKMDLFNHTVAITNNEKEINDKINYINQLTGQLDQLEDIKNGLETRFNELEVHSKQQINLLKQEIDERDQILENQRNIHESEISNKVNEMNNLHQDLLYKTTELTEVKASYQAIESEMINKQSMISQMTKEIDRLNQINAENSNKIEVNENFLINLNKSYEKLNKDVHLLEKDISTKDNFIDLINKKNNELTKEIAELTNENDYLQNQAKTSLQTVEILTSKVDNLEKCLEIELKNYRELLHEKDEIVERNEELNSQIDNLKFKLQKETEQLKEKITIFNSNNAQLNTEISELNKNIEVKTLENEGILKQNQMIEEKCNNLQDKLNQQETEILEKNSEISVYKTTVSEKEAAILSNREENAKLKIKIEEKMNNCEQLTEQIKSFTEKIVDLEQNLELKSKSLLQYEEKINIISQEKLSLTEELTLLISEKNIISDEGNLKIKKLEEEINIAKEKYKECNLKIENYVKIVSELNLEKTTVHNEVTDLSIELENIKHKNTDLLHEKDCLQNTIISLENDIQIRSDQAEKYESEITELKTNINDFENNILQLEKIITEKMATYNECVERLTEKDLHIIQLESELKDLMSSNELLETNCKNLEQKIDSMKQNGEKQQSEINKFQENVISKQKLLEEISTKSELLESENTNLKASVDKINELVSTKEEIIESLKLQLNTKEEDSSKSKLETEQLRACLTQKDETLEQKNSQIKRLIQESDEFNNIVDKIMSEYQQDDKFNESKENSLCEDFTSLEYIDGHSTEFKKPNNVVKDLKQKLVDIHKSFESITKTCAHTILEKEDIIENVKSSLDVEIKNNKLLQADIEEISNKYKQNKNITESLSGEIEELKSKMIVKDKMIEELHEVQKERDVLAAETTLLTDINNTLERNIDQLRSELHILKQNEQSLQTTLYNKVQIITDIDEKNKTNIVNIKDILKNCLKEIILSVDENNHSLEELLVNMNETESFESVVELFDTFTKRLMALISWLVDERANLREKLMVSATCDDTKLDILNKTLRDSQCSNISGEVSSTTLGLSAAKSENANMDDLKTFASEIEESNLILRNVVDANKSNRKKTQELKNMFCKMQNTILNSSTNQSTMANALSKINEWEEKIHLMEQNSEENHDKLYDFTEKFYNWIDKSIQSICKDGRNEGMSSNFNLNSDLQTICNQSYVLKELLNKTKIIFKEIDNQNIFKSLQSEEIGESTTLKNNAIYNILEERCNLREEINSLKNDHLSLQEMYHIAKIENEDHINKICNLREILKNMETEHMKIRKSIQDTESQNNILKNENAELNEKVKQVKTNFDKKVVESRNVDTNQLVSDMKLEYEDKLARMKQKMKQLYQEEINKLTDLHTKDKADMENLLKKYMEKVDNYERHTNELSSQLWKVGERLLMEKNENEFLKKQVREHRHSSQQSLNSIKSLPQTSSNVEEWRKKSHLAMPRNSISRLPEYANQKPPRPSISVPKFDEFKVPLPTKVESGGLHVSDEEGEIFDNTYLPALKMGVCEPRANSTSNNANNSLMQPDRLSELQWRNSLCLPHLKSSYPVEMQFRKHKEEDIKIGVENLNESIVVEKTKPKKEIGQTAYKKPGPPTPSKKGGRLSLQGNEGREPLKEYNDNAGNTKKTTPSRFKSLFSSNNSKSSSRDENTGTPKRLSIFRSRR